MMTHTIILPDEEKYEKVWNELRALEGMYGKNNKAAVIKLLLKKYKDHYDEDLVKEE